MPDGSFFHRYINDAYRFLPENDRAFLSEFWTALIQMAGDVEQQLLEANLNRYLGEMLTFSLDRWRRYSFGIAATTTAVVTESVTFTGAAPVALQHQSLLSFGLLLTRASSGFQFAYGTDYTVDFAAGTITRPPGSAITLGAAAELRYTYVTRSPVVSGYPYVMDVDANVVSIPLLQDAITVVDGTTLLYENVDYVVGNGALSFKVQPAPHLWAEKTFVDDETPYRRFGVLIDYYLSNSPQYVQALRGLYFAYFRGSQVETIENAVRLMLGLPSAFRDGTITHVIDAPIYARIDTITKPYTIRTAFGEPAVTALHEKGLVRVTGIGGYSKALRVRSVVGSVIELYEDAFDDYDSAAPPPAIVPADVMVYIPRQIGYLGDDSVLRYEEVFPDLTILVAVGQAVTRYQPFVSGTKVIDKLVNPDFVVDEVGRAGIQRFLTDAATTGLGPTTDESIALETLSSHLWVMQIHGAVFNYLVGLGDVVAFLEKIKPQYTEYIFQILENFEEPLAIDEQEEKVLTVDLTYTVGSNVPNVEVFDIQMELVSFIQATRVVTVAAPHDLTVFATVGEKVTITGLGADDGVYTIQGGIAALSMQLVEAPSADHPAPLAGTERIYVRGTDDEYTAAGAYPYLGVGAGHPYMNEMAEVDVAFGANPLAVPYVPNLDEIRVVGPNYFLDSGAATHFTLWDIVVTVDQVTVAGAANGVNNDSWTVLSVVSDVTLQVDGGGGPMIAEGAGVNGTITLVPTKTKAL